jgi:hypothetical protein
MQVDGRPHIGQRLGYVVIHSLTANIGQFGFRCNSLVHFFLLWATVFALDSNENYFNSRNLALPPRLQSLLGSTHALWTVKCR